MHWRYCSLAISHQYTDDIQGTPYVAGIFIEKLTKTPHSLPVRVRYGVSLWVLSLTQLYHCNCCAVCKVVLYMSLIYQEFIVFSWYWSKCWVNLVVADGLVLVYYNTFTSHSRLAKLPYGLNIKCPWLDLAEDHFMNQILFLTEINPNIVKLALIFNSEQGLGCNVAKLT